SESTDQPLARPAAEPQSISTSLPIAIFQGKLKIGNADFICYVLDNGKRVLAQREVVRLFTGYAKGNLGRYLEAHNLQQFINKDAILRQTVRFILPGTQLEGDGFEALLILDICDAYLLARDKDALFDNQLH